MHDVQFVQAFVPDDHPIRSHLSMAAEYITIHETANPRVGATDEMHRNYLLTQDAIDREVLWHATVDCDSICQHLPWNEVGWHAGDGYDGPGNRKSIGVELCVNVDGDFEATKRNAAWLVVKLLKEVPTLRPWPECLEQHHRWSGKNCPTIIRATPGGWEALIAMVDAILKPPAPPAPPLQVVPIVLLGMVHKEGLLLNGRTWCPMRAVLESLGHRVQWTPAGAVLIDGAQLPAALAMIPAVVLPNGCVIEGETRDGSTWAPIRPLLEGLGYVVTWAAGIVMVDRPAPAPCG